MTLLSTLLLIAPAACYLTGALTSRYLGWRIARGAALLALASMLAGVVIVVIDQPAVPSPWIATSALHLVTGLLVATVGYVVTRYSETYMAGDIAEVHFRNWLQLCLASTSLIVLTDNLLVLVLTWSAISICLHQLLMCYPNRFRAVLAAHKKFILARLAELCLVGAVALLWQFHETLRITEILAYYSADVTLTASEQAAALLLTVAALIKCAQLPAHGWLIQVVEAPTPVSALLHAGIVNLGGFLMILMAPLMMQAEPARWLLLIVAGLTTTLAALVMMTRISVKVRLAWSTSAQMGLMLVECALGLHELALLHLVAHASYKAHAFLTSGSAVSAYLEQQLRHSPNKRWLPRLAIAFAMTATVLWLLPGAASPAEWAAWTLLALATALWLPATSGIRDLARNAATALLLTGAYVAQKTVFAELLPPTPDAGWAASVWILLMVGLLIAGYILMMPKGSGPFAARCRRWLFAGFYLDEWFTRTTLKIWPVTFPRSVSRKPATPLEHWRHANEQPA